MVSICDKWHIDNPGKECKEGDCPPGCICNKDVCIARDEDSPEPEEVPVEETLTPLAVTERTPVFVIEPLVTGRQQRRQRRREQQEQRELRKKLKSLEKLNIRKRGRSTSSKRRQQRRLRRAKCNICWGTQNLSTPCNCQHLWHSECINNIIRAGGPAWCPYCRAPCTNASAQAAAPNFLQRFRFDDWNDYGDFECFLLWLKMELHRLALYMGRGNPRQGGKNIGFLLLVMIVTYNEVRNRFGDDDDFKGGQGKATSIEIENLKNKIINLPPTYWRILSILAKYRVQKPKYSKLLKLHREDGFG